MISPESAGLAKLLSKLTRQPASALTAPKAKARGRRGEGEKRILMDGNGLKFEMDLFACYIDIMGNYPAFIHESLHNEHSMSTATTGTSHDNILPSPISNKRA
jgi:hypothetical protein